MKVITPIWTSWGFFNFLFFFPQSEQPTFVFSVGIGPRDFGDQARRVHLTDEVRIYICIGAKWGSDSHPAFWAVGLEWNNTSRVFFPTFNAEVTAWRGRDLFASIDVIWIFPISVFQKTNEQTPRKWWSARKSAPERNALLSVSLGQRVLSCPWTDCYFCPKKELPEGINRASC